MANWGRGKRCPFVPQITYVLLGTHRERAATEGEPGTQTVSPLTAANVNEVAQALRVLVNILAASRDPSERNPSSYKAIVAMIRNLCGKSCVGWASIQYRPLETRKTAAV